MNGLGELLSVGSVLWSQEWQRVSRTITKLIPVGNRVRERLCKSHWCHKSKTKAKAKLQLLNLLAKGHCYQPDNHCQTHLSARSFTSLGFSSRRRSEGSSYQSSLRLPNHRVTGNKYNAGSCIPDGRQKSKETRSHMRARFHSEALREEGKFSTGILGVYMQNFSLVSAVSIDLKCRVASKTLSAHQSDAFRLPKHMRCLSLVRRKPFSQTPRKVTLENLLSDRKAPGLICSYPGVFLIIISYLQALD